MPDNEEEFSDALLEDFAVQELEDRFEFDACCNFGCNDGCELAEEPS